MHFYLFFMLIKLKVSSFFDFQTTSELTNMSFVHELNQLILKKQL